MGRNQTEDKSLYGLGEHALSTTTLPRASSFVKDLLFVLNEGRLRTCEVAKITEKTSAYVDSYLRRMRNQGLVEKQGFFWNLSEDGVSFLGYLEKIEDRRYRYRHYLDTTTTQHQHSLNSRNPKKIKQVPLLPFLHNLSLPDAERKVVEMLLEHYDETHSLFLYFPTFYDIADHFQASPDQIRQIMRNLKQDHIAYPWRDRSQDAWKIALYKEFVEMLPLNHNVEKQNQSL